MMKKEKAIILLSGGLDSATCGLIARDMGFEIYALSFSYGQRHAFELLAAQKVAFFLNAKEHRVVDIDLAALGGSTLTSCEAGIPAGGASGVPSTYVPARNTVFLSYALAWAEVLGVMDIFIGVNCIDYSGYPDCRPEFIAAFQKMANLATVAATAGKELAIRAPLMFLSKAEIIQIGLKAGFDYGATHSCYDPDSKTGRACGVCDSCLLRKKGFDEVGIPDPALF